MKKSFYFPHDFGARNDPKIQELIMRHGVAGVGTYWCIVEQLYEQGGRLSLKLCKSIAFALHLDEEDVNSVILDFGLFDNDGNEFWSNSVLSRVEKMEEIVNRRRSAARARWDNKGSSKKLDNQEDKNASSNVNATPHDANAMQMQCKCNANAMQIKEKKGNILFEDKSSHNSRLLFEDKSSHNNPSLSSAREDFDEAQNCDDKQIENEQAKKKVARFVPPTIEEVQNYISEKNYEDYVSADYFINFHESKGWMIGKNKMKDWRAAVRTWVLRAKEQQKEKRQKQTLDVNSEWR